MLFVCQSVIFFCVCYWRFAIMAPPRPSKAKAKTKHLGQRPVHKPKRLGPSSSASGRQTTMEEHMARFFTRPQSKAVISETDEELSGDDGSKPDTDTPLLRKLSPGSASTPKPLPPCWCWCDQIPSSQHFPARWQRAVGPLLTPSGLPSQGPNLPSLP